jgi:hypothetical protein
MCLSRRSDRPSWILRGDDNSTTARNHTGRQPAFIRCVQ